ncbi:lysophospholipase [Neohortaea acidophila]|uniref:Lysophospholipase n=1 Tax=Neohortaea acidophila TaxID=245834 RepID=A0A6A6PNK5_9PEZI|nr:lysophospholipase [Neohortaea acidophila]KAF2481690.1 lysophospholipase [Neohortaea acidophila]
MLLPTLSLLPLAFSALADAAPTQAQAKSPKVGLTPYAPVSTSCPSTPLVRPASGISSQEASYVSARHAKAAGSTTSYIRKWGHHGSSSSSTKLPVIGFTSSGGGYRSLLTTAGVVEAFDNRESSSGVAGIYQSLTYQGGLSGGAWFLSSLAANNWPTITSLRDNLWGPAFQNSLLVPANLLSTSDDTIYAAVAADIAAKAAAGYNVTIVDPYGRLLSYQLLYGSDGGVRDTLSGLTGLSNFTEHNVPYPIMTTTIDFPAEGQCAPSITGPIFEFHPYEYGSWDQGVDAFAVTSYMGSKLSNGKPVSQSSCVANYDNIGYVFGTSSDVFNIALGGVCFTPPTGSDNILEAFETLVAAVETPSEDDLFALYENPFYNYKSSSLVSNLTQLTLSDGGEAGQNNPIWPFIQPARDVDVLIVNDNSADTDGNLPNGTEIYQTYLNAQQFGLKKMPYIPPVNTFVSEGLNERATFFGCNETDTVFIIYLPNVPYIYPSGTSTAMLEYTEAQTDGMIANGVQIALQNGTAGWPECLACGINTKSGAKPSSTCNACFKKYCYYH